MIDGKGHSLNPNSFSNCVAAAYSLTWSDACPELRIIQPLERLGIKVLRCDAATDSVEDVNDADLVLINRELSGNTDFVERLIARARTLGKTVILLLDDLLLEVPKSHPNYFSYLSLQIPLIYTLCEVDAVITTSEYLASELSQYNDQVFVVPNSLDDDLWAGALAQKPSRQNEPLVIGYMGSSTHEKDLENIEQPLLDILNSNSGKVVARFLGQPPTGPLANHPLISWKPYSPDYRSFVRDLETERIDIAVAPLDNNRFNRCKSTVKFLEYSALAIPAVYSNIPPYNSIVRHEETGLLASSVDEFQSCLRRLIESAELRQKIGAAAQDDVRANHLLSKRVPDWQRAFHRAMAASRDTKRDIAVPKRVFLQIARTVSKDAWKLQSELYDLKFKLSIAEIDVRELRRIKSGKTWRILHSIWHLNRSHKRLAISARKLLGKDSSSDKNQLEKKCQMLQLENENLRELLTVYMNRLQALGADSTPPHRP